MNASTGPSRRSHRRRAGAETLGLCTDEEVNGAPFYVMTMVDGTW